MAYIPMCLSYTTLWVIYEVSEWLGWEISYINTHFLMEISDILAHFESFFDILRTLI